MGEKGWGNGPYSDARDEKETSAGVRDANENMGGDCKVGDYNGGNSKCGDNKGGDNKGGNGGKGKIPDMDKKEAHDVFSSDRKPYS